MSLKQDDGGFARQAESILEAAESAGSCSDLTILLGPDGIHLIADSDWPLDSLLWTRGAKTAYRVSQRGGSICVEGRQGSRRCLVQSNSAARSARFLLDGTAAHF